MIEHTGAKSVAIVALFSRILIWLMQVIFNYAIVDHQPDVFDPPGITTGWTGADRLVELLLGGFRRWDSIYFIHIAEHGYTYENTLAFFPLMPLAIRLIGHTLLLPLHNYLTLRHVLMIAAFLVNNTAFIIAALYVYRLGRELLGKGNLCWFAAVLFCFNPASTFMSAAYSESLFAAASFSFMYYVEKRQYTRATIAMGIATATRSNGIILAGYPGYAAFRLVFTNNPEDRKFINIASNWLKLASCFLYGLIPFFFFQYMTFMLYCTNRKMVMDARLLEYGKESGYHLPSDNPSEWCHYSLPFSYSYIQSNHWNVGFLKYYEIKQFPNFLIATPVIVLSFFTVKVYVGRCSDSLMELRNFRQWMDSRPMKFLPYAFHLAFLVVYGLANVHIQILTRLVYSSSPLIYLHIARYAAQYFNKSSNSRLFKAVMAHFVFYFVIGTLVHCNFLPWT